MTMGIVHLGLKAPECTLWNIGRIGLRLCKAKFTKEKNGLSVKHADSLSSAIRVPICRLPKSVLVKVQHMRPADSR